MAMTNDKLFKKIIALTQKIDSDWQDDLYTFGILDMFQEIYDRSQDKLKANTIIAYIILAYCNSSDWIVMSQERMRNKHNILKKLGVPENELSKDFWLNIITKKDVLVNSITEKFLDWQKDSRWESVIIKKEYYSTNIQLVNQEIKYTKEVMYRGEIIPLKLSDEELLKAQIAKGKLLTEAHDQEQSARKIFESIENDFLKINAILAQEDENSITSDVGSTWESQITKRNQKADF